MAIFNKKEKKLRQELLTRNINNCRDSLIETTEVYEDLKAAAQDIGSLTESFKEIASKMEALAGKEGVENLERFTMELSRADNFANNAVRDLRDLVRNHKKRLKEAQRDQ